MKRETYQLEVFEDGRAKVFVIGTGDAGKRAPEFESITGACDWIRGHQGESLGAGLFAYRAAMREAARGCVAPPRPDSAHATPYPNQLNGSNLKMPGTNGLNTYANNDFQTSVVEGVK